MGAVETHAPSQPIVCLLVAYADLAQMPYAGLRRLLRFYGQPIIGTTDMLRQRLKAFIGQAP